MQKAGDTLANTMNMNCYTAAYEGTREAIAAAQRKKARKSEDKSEAGIPTAESYEEKDFVTLQSSSIDVGIAMQHFCAVPRSRLSKCSSTSWPPRTVSIHGIKFTRKSSPRGSRQGNGCSIS